VGKSQRDKGLRVEREIVNAHTDAGIRAERVPLSGAMHYQGNAGDIDVYPRGRDAPIIGEVKARKNGAGFATLEKWMGDCDFLVLKRNNAPPMVAVPWHIWVELLGGKISDDADDN
jgi:Holliday junction resolvase